MRGLEVRGLGVSVGGKKLVDGASFVARSGDVTCLIGPNGAGKSTLIKALAGIHDYSGLAILNDVELKTMGRRARAATLGYAPQRSHIVLPFDALEVVTQGLYAESGDAWAAPKGQRDRAMAALDEVGLTAFASRVFHTLSGGEQQLVMLARALVNEPSLLLLDEPSSALDIQHRLDLESRLRRLASAGLIVLVVLHDLLQVLQCSDSVVMLAAGRVVAQGPAREALGAPICGRVFGVELVDGPGPGFKRLGSAP